jgi:hypothetical protein
MLLEIFQFVAIFSCTIFAGAAVYINAAEHPARMECGTELAASVFGPSYRRAAVLQASLAIIATISGVACGIMSGASDWYLGAALIFFVVPFTFAVIMPTNKRLLSPSLDRTSVEAAALLVRWGQLHAVRSGFSILSSWVYIYLGTST